MTDQRPVPEVLQETDSKEVAPGGGSRVVSAAASSRPAGWGAGVRRVVLRVPRNLWMSANRPVTNHAQRARVVRDLHALAAWTARHAGLGPVAEPCSIVWEVSYPKGTGAKADPPNAAPTTKAVLDGLVAAGHLTDDNPDVVVAQTFTRGPNTKVRGLHQITLTLIEETP